MLAGTRPPCSCLALCRVVPSRRTPFFVAYSSVTGLRPGVVNLLYSSEPPLLSPLLLGPPKQHSMSGANGQNGPCHQGSRPQKGLRCLRAHYIWVHGQQLQLIGASYPCTTTGKMKRLRNRVPTTLISVPMTKEAERRGMQQGSQFPSYFQYFSPPSRPSLHSAMYQPTEHRENPKCVVSE